MVFKKTIVLMQFNAMMINTPIRDIANICFVILNHVLLFLLLFILYLFVDFRVETLVGSGVYSRTV